MINRALDRLPSLGKIWGVALALSLTIVSLNTLYAPADRGAAAPEVSKVDGWVFPKEWSLPSGTYVTLDYHTRRVFPE